MSRVAARATCVVACFPITFVYVFGVLEHDRRTMPVFNHATGERK